jgi:hypothetical protein
MDARNLESASRNVVLAVSVATKERKVTQRKLRGL